MPLAVLERLPAWLAQRCVVEPKALAALAVVLAGLTVLAGAHFWSSGPQPVGAPEVVRGVAADVGSAQLAGSAGEKAEPPVGAPAGPPAESAVPGRIVIDVSGKVRRPGVQHLPVGSRVVDALRAAGGASSGADLTGLNRARVLLDGEQVLVGLPGVPAPPGASGGDGSAGDGGGGTAGAPLSLNAATGPQLEALPGVGPVLAQHILDYRTQQGGFRSVDELREVKGIGEGRFADLEPLVRL